MGAPFLIAPTPEQFREQNDQVLLAISHWHHRAFGFVYLNPEYLQESLQELDRCVKDGPMTGIKLWVAKRCDSASVDAIVRRAIELKAIIYQHTWLKTTGNLDGESTPADLNALASRHPEASIICGHTGGNWELGIRTIRDLPHVSVDLGGGDPTAGIVEMAVRELGASRVLYGSDVAGRSFASQLGKVNAAEITPQEKQMILGQNLRRLMSPILQAKGVRL
jgi:predicted TIM-barrel fold metal-dependent hydrolase